jgi:hypothetical protein
MVNTPHDPFPFLLHRTLAEVARTHDLLAAAACRQLHPAELRELDQLLIKARRQNPHTGLAT